ncbi:hypothetical protein [Dulcicalothrix desertica]|uniref:hypothetical protein n=1 Tax=Dulcicalothrix desertica TaxID=32056 RepID=UPI000F8D3D6C|nr:hypothetical protein [Dulcicalothrix desertica]TWH55424.1 hypothetical protein CAL7102_03560 [Dulcicalothrix desertica PCC 7102]
MHKQSSVCLMLIKPTDDIMEDENLLMEARSTGYQGFQICFMQLSDYYGISTLCGQGLKVYI